MDRFVLNTLSLPQLENRMTVEPSFDSMGCPPELAVGRGAE